MYFTDIPGQAELKSYLTSLVAKNRLPHAMLLTGGEGYGKLALALALSTYLQCPNKTDEDACKACPSCNKANQLIHPDIYYAYPVIKKDKLKREDTTSQHFLPEWRTFVAEQPYGNMKDWLRQLDAPDKNANINVAECNQIFKNLGLKTYEGAYKIQLIWYAELLGKEGNRLLKLIEEPRPDTVIILIAHDRSALLNTLISRCQIIPVPPVDDQSIQQLVENKYELSTEDTQELTFLAAGNIRKALSLGVQNELTYSEDLIKWLRVSYSGDPEAIVALVDDMAAKGRQELVNFLDYGLHFFREYLLLLNTGVVNNLRLTQTEKEVAQKMQKIINFEKTAQIQLVFEQALGYIKRNLALKVLIMNMTLEISHILKSEVDNFVS